MSNPTLWYCGRFFPAHRRCDHLLSLVRKSGFLPGVLAFVLSVSGQTDPTTPAANNSSRETAEYQEQVYVHTDRNWYITGETLWCSLFVTDTRTRQASRLSRVAYLELLDPSGKPAWQAMVRVDSGRGRASWQIPSSLPTAGYTLRAYTRWMRNQPAERFFHRALYIVNPEKKPMIPSAGGKAPGPLVPLPPPASQSITVASLSVQTDASTYGLRRPVEITIQAKDAGGKPLASTISVTVTRAGNEPNNPLDQTQPGMGNGVDIQIKNSTSDNDDPSPMNKMSAQDQSGRPLFVPEPAGPVASVRVQHKLTGKPAPGVLVSLSVPGNRFQIAIARSDTDGRAMFPLEFQEGSGVLAYAFLDQSRDSLMLAPLSMYDDRATSLASTLQLSSDMFKAAVEPQLPDVQLARAFQQSSIGPMLVRDKDDTTAFFGLPDRVYQLDDYVRFATMEEVFKEYVREVEVRKSKTDYKLRVLNAPMRSFFNDDPLILLDGIPIRDINRVMRFDPLKLRSMEIITRRYYLGGQGFAGVLVLHTYPGDMGGTDLPEDVLVTEYDGLLPPYAFFAPDYSVESGTRSPDLRRTLCWAPILECGLAEPCKLRLFTGDVPGRYRVFIHALTSDGNQLESSVFFEVR